MALSDALGLTAQPLQTIERASNAAAIKRVLETAAAHDVEEIVVGIPYSARGSLTAQGEKVARFAQLLAARAGVPVVRWDERHTTQTAERVLLAADLRRAKRKLVRDKMAAVVLLQDYLEARKRSGNAHGEAD